MTKKTKRAIMCMLCLTPLLVLPQTQYAKEQVKKVEEVEKAPQLPVKVDADSIYYVGQDGDFSAKGDVILTQGPKRLKTQLIEGNVNTEEYNAPGDVRFTDKGMNVTGKNMTYKGGTYADMSLEDIFGKMNAYYVKGEKFHFKDDEGNGKGEVENAMLTTENAMAWKVAPDYRIEGEHVDIIPKEKMVIKNAKFYIKNWHFMTLGKYTSSLVPNPYGKRVSPFNLIPKPSYRAKSGFGVRGGVSYPLSPHTYAYYKYAWYSKVGYKPNLGYAYRDSWGGATLSYRKEESSVNEDYVWVTKKPELSIYMDRIQIGRTPFYFAADATAGYWKEKNIKGSHYFYNGAITHKPIPLWKNASMNFKFGYQKDYYGYNKSERDMPYWNVGINYRATPKLSLHTYYYENHNNGDTPYYFDRYEFNKHLDFGLYYQIDRLNGIGIYWKEDTVDHHLAYQNIVYYRDLHSFKARITYKTKQKAIEYKIIAKDF